MTTEDKPAKPCSPLIRRLRLCRRVLLAIVLVLALVTFLGTRYLRDPQRAGRLAVMLLESLTSSKATIRAAHVSLDGTIVLDDLELRTASSQDASGTLLRAPQTTIEYDWTSVLRGRVEPSRIVLYRPEIFVTEDLDAGGFTFHQALQGAKPSPGAGPPARLPEVFLYEARVVFGEHSKLEGYRQTATLAVAGSLTQHATQPRSYAFTLTHRGVKGMPGPALVGDIDLEQRRISSELRALPLEGPLRFCLPREMRQWYERLSPKGGSMSARLRFDAAKGIDAVLNLENAAFKLPYERLELPLTEVSAEFELNHGIRLSIDGKLDDPDYRAHYKVQGVAAGYSADSAFKLTVTVPEAEIPGEPQKLRAFPQELREVFARFLPQGQFSGQVVVEREKAGGELDFRGEVDVIHASARYERFPYPLQDASGRIAFDSKQVRVIDLRGPGPSGGMITINGTVDSPELGDAVHMIVQATDLALDETLLKAMGPHGREAAELFIDPHEYARLQDEGVVITSTNFAAAQQTLTGLRSDLPAASEAERGSILKQIQEIESRIARAKVFDVGGRLNALVRIDRPSGPVPDYRTTVEIEPTQFHAIYKRWPYPLIVTGGKLLIHPPQITVQDLKIEGLTGVKGVITGTILPPPSAEYNFQPDIRITGKGMPVDELLLASIPPTHRDVLRDLQISSTVDLLANIGVDDQKQIDYTITADLQGGHARPYTGGYRLDDLTGRVVIRDEQIAIQDVAARHDETQLRINGNWASSSPQKPGELKLVFDATKVKVEDPLLDLVPPSKRGAIGVDAFYSRWKPSGVTDLQLTWNDTAAGSGFDLKLSPQSLQVFRGDQPIAWRDMSGYIRITPDRIQLHQLSGSFDSGSATLEGQTTVDPTAQGDLQFAVKTLSQSATFRAMLPDEVRSTLDGLKFNGDLHITQGRLEWQTDARGLRHVHSTTQAAVSNAKADLGVDVTDLDGDIFVQADVEPQQTWPLLDLKLQAKRMRALRRTISPFILQMNNAEERDILRIRELKGNCYGGMIVGEGWQQLSPRGAYSLDLRLQDAAVAPISKPDSDAGLPQDASSGSLSASLNLEGLRGDVESRRGRAHVQVRDAALFDLPVALAVIQLVNFSVPRSRHFDRADCEIILEGNLLRIDSIRLQATTLEFLGDGVMSFPTGEIDLLLRTRNPATPNLGALTQLVDIVRDTLLTIHVTGTLDQPRATVLTLSGVKRTWEEVFGPVYKRFPKQLMNVVNGEPPKQ